MSTPPIQTSVSTSRASALRTRILSAIVLMPATIGAVYLGGRVFAALVAFLCVLMVFEWTRMVERRELSPSFYLIAFAGAAAMFIAVSGAYAIAFVICAVAGVASIAETRLRGRVDVWPSLAIPYVVAPSISLMWLRIEPAEGRELAFWLFFTVWAADSGAFFFGKFLGGPKISHALSPSKTWAGIGGGIMGGALIGVVAGHQLFELMELFPSIAAGAGLGAVSVAGDLFESGVKRRFGVKDISGFIPGHGGVLDRLDGMIFATIAMTGALMAFMVVEKVQG